MVKKKAFPLKAVLAATGIVAVILIVALAAIPQGNNAQINIKWNSLADAQKAPDSESPKAVEITVYQAADTYSQVYWNNGYHSTNQALNYNPSDGIALVKETRNVNIPAGLASLAIKGTSAFLDPTSVHLSDLSGKSLSILEQNYDYDLVDGYKLLDKYIDKQVTVKSGNDTTTGILLSASGPVIKTASGVTVLSGYDKVDFPSLPEGLITTPTISWLLDSQSAGSRDVEVSYLTSGLNWNANYVAIDNADDTKISLQGWVSLRNDAGTTFKDAKLKLVAGDVNVVRQTPYPTYEGMDSASGIKVAGVTEQSFFEYHLYTLERPTTIASGQVKQVEMTSASDVATKKEYVFDASSSSKVAVTLSFNNTEKAGLGIALPKGKVRVYKADSTGSLQFLGEDSIDHTPKDEAVTLSIGNAFDIVGEKTTTATEYSGSCANRYSYNITLRNHKSEAVTVKVIEHAYGEWDVTSETATHTKDSAYQLSWNVPVAADGSATVLYTIRSVTC
ncbi:MAG: DUF4139 domain-containing protein [Candidatus Micrarchaeia archaeon]